MAGPNSLFRSQATVPRAAGGPQAPDLVENKEKIFLNRW